MKLTKRKIAVHTLRILLVLIGLYVVWDGVGSIIEYWTQHWYEHAVRVGRIVCGLLAIWLAYELPSVIALRKLRIRHWWNQNMKRIHQKSIFELNEEWERELLKGLG
jgi:uncharacterized membrane protein YcjF (UPF0283 family)